MANDSTEGTTAAARAPGAGTPASAPGTGRAAGRVDGTRATGALGTLARSSVLLAALTVQAVAFAALYAVGRPTLYLFVALVSAALLGWRADEGLFGVAAATLGAVLLLALGMPLVLFVARLDPGLVAEKALDPAVHRMLYLTVYGPLLAALASLAFGVPLAYLLSRGFRGQALVESLVDLPLVVPHSVAGVLILFGFGGDGLFPTGGPFPGFSVLGTMAGFVLALTFVSAPFAVNGAREAFESVDRRLVYAARSHGAGPFGAFARVVLPLSSRGILTGGVLAWARGVSEFGAVAVVAYSVSFFYPGTFSEVTSYHAPVFIFKAFTGGGLDESSAVAAILLALSAGIFLLVRWVAYDEGGIL